MTMLVVGEMAVGQTAYFCRKAFASLGVRTVAVDTTGYPFARWRAAAVPAVPVISHLLQYVWVNTLLPAVARRVKPAALFVTGGREIRARTLQQVKQATNATLLNWNTDNPLNAVNSSPEMLAAIPLYDCHFAWGKFLIPHFMRLAARRVEYLPFCYDPELHSPAQLQPAERERLQCDLVFAGTWEPAREAYLDHLAGCDLQLWGNHWHRLGPASPLRKCWRGVAEGRQLAQVLSAAKIALNFVREQNGPAHNLRTFEAPACGAFMLATRTEEQVELLGEDVGAAFFASPEEMHDKVKYYLRHASRREAIARRGYEIVSRGHTYQDRMTAVLATVSLDAVALR